MLAGLYLAYVDRSVFFDGHIQRVGKTFLHSSWLSVRIGANTDGIYIISAEKEVSRRLTISPYNVLFVERPLL